MKSFHLSPAACGLMFPLLLLIAACGSRDGADAPNTANPPEASLRGEPFTLSVLDQERGFCRDSVYVFEGEYRDGHFWFGSEKKDTMQLNITPDNGIVLKVRSDSPDFEGVNAASSSRCINIVPDGRDRCTYHLEWVAEGRSTISLWCGEGPDRQELRFSATSRKEIPMEGIKVRLDGQEYRMRRRTAAEQEHPTLFSDPAIHFNGTGDRYFPDKMSSGYVTLEIIGPEPLNATPTTTLNMAYDCFGIADHYADIRYNARAYSKRLSTFVQGDIWNKHYGLYEENKAKYRDFRWFAPFIWEEGTYYKKNLALPVEDPEYDVPGIYFIDGGPRGMYREYHDAGNYTYRPADLRERRILVWPQISERIFLLGLYEGGFTEKKDPGSPSGQNLVYYDLLYDIWIQFDNIREYAATDDYHPCLKSEHGYYEP